MTNSRDPLLMVRAELSSLADKVMHAGKAGYFDNWQPSYRRAMRVLKQTAPPTDGAEPDSAKVRAPKSSTKAGA